MNNSSIRLDGQKILITGVSRPLGIGATLAKRMAEAGATVAVHGFSDYDVTVGNHLSSMPNLRSYLKCLTVVLPFLCKYGNDYMNFDKIAEAPLLNKESRGFRRGN